VTYRVKIRYAASGKTLSLRQTWRVYSIATVVDDFINRIMVDPRLNANPQVDEAHHRVPPAGFKYLVTEMVCWATGGRKNTQVSPWRILMPI
jgi:hypothetical protein